MDVFKLTSRYKCKNKNIKSEHIKSGKYYINLLECSRSYDNTIKELLSYYIKELGEDIKLPLNLEIYKSVSFNITHMNDIKYLMAIEICNGVFDYRCIETNMSKCYKLREIVDMYCYKFPEYQSDKLKLVQNLEGKLKSDLIDAMITDTL